jgi:hypothetical protein
MGSAFEGAWLHDTKWKIPSKQLLSPPNPVCSNKNSGGLTARAQGQVRNGTLSRMAVNYEHTGSSLEAIRQNQLAA